MRDAKLTPCVRVRAGNEQRDERPILPDDAAESDERTESTHDAAHASTAARRLDASMAAFRSAAGSSGVSSAKDAW